MTSAAPEPLRPPCRCMLRFIISGEGAGTARTARLCASKPTDFSNLCSGAWLRKRGFIHACVAVAIAGSLLARGWAQTQDEPAAGTSACFHAKIGKIEFPGINESDQPMLRGLIAAHPGEPLNRRQLQQSLRVLFSTGRFADLRAECQRFTDDSVQLTFVGTPTFFVGKITVEGAPGRPTESQVVNASKLQLGE